jgi:hypothetical protein
MEVAVVVAQVLGRLVRHVAPTQLPGQLSALFCDVAPIHFRGTSFDRQFLQSASRETDPYHFISASVRGRHHPVREAAI